jgi:hypothetical protein
MLIVVAPASMTASITSYRKSQSERVASIGENSTSEQYDLARLTISTASSLPCSRVRRNCFSRWISEVERNVCKRGDSATLTASQSVSMSEGTARASPVTIRPLISRAICWTAAKSSGEAAGKPASMMSTFSRSSCLANSSFCSDVSEKPGDCSPSRSVVSKIRTCPATANSRRFLGAGFWVLGSRGGLQALRDGKPLPRT